MDRKTAIENIIEFFYTHEDIYNDVIEDLDSYNGFLGGDRYYCMDDISELYSGAEIIDLLNRVFYGYDADSWHTDSHGEREHGAFNPNREYFTFNAYGNLVSTDYKDYSAWLDENAVEDMAENRNYIYALEYNDELSTLFDELEEAEE